MIDATKRHAIKVLGGLVVVSALLGAARTTYAQTLTGQQAAELARIQAEAAAQRRRMDQEQRRIREDIRRRNEERLRRLQEAQRRARTG